MIEHLVGYFWIFMIVVDAVVTRRDPDWLDTWDFFFGIYYIGMCGMTAVYHLVNGRPGGFGIFLFLAIAYAILWWRNGRNKRKKLADKAAGIVTDVGGRLKVVREPVAES